MKHILQLLQVKQIEDVLLLYLKFTYVANALTIMMSLKIFAPQPSEVVPQLHATVMAGSGHCVGEEKAAGVNAALLMFLQGL